jgi:hypothetical protein
MLSVAEFKSLNIQILFLNGKIGFQTARMYVIPTLLTVYLWLGNEIKLVANKGSQKFVE